MLLAQKLIDRICKFF